MPLLQPTLALLDKFGPFFSIEYHGELLGALEGLLKTPRLPLALRLSCLSSASAITSCALVLLTCMSCICDLSGREAVDQLDCTQLSLK